MNFPHDRALGKRAIHNREKKQELYSIHSILLFPVELPVKPPNHECGINRSFHADKKKTAQETITVSGLTGSDRKFFVNLFHLISLLLRLPYILFNIDLAC